MALGFEPGASMNDLAGFGADEDVPRAQLALLFKQFSNPAGAREPSRAAYPLAGVVFLRPAPPSFHAASGKHNLAFPRKVPLFHQGVPCERGPPAGIVLQIVSSSFKERHRRVMKTLSVPRPRRSIARGQVNMTAPARR